MLGRWLSGGAGAGARATDRRRLRLRLALERALARDALSGREVRRPVGHFTFRALAQRPSLSLSLSLSLSRMQAVYSFSQK